jgi:hypothetical protein
MSKRFILSGLCIAVGFILCILALRAREPETYAQGANAISKGLEYARTAGLVDDPTDMTIARIDYTAFRKLIEPTWEPSELEIQANRAVWVLEIKGEVVLNLPGAVGERYGNLTVVIDATGELVEIAARAPGYEVGLQGEHVTIVDGERFPLVEITGGPSVPSAPTATPALNP